MDLMKLIYKNSFMQMGFFLGLFGLMYSQKYLTEVQRGYDISLLLIIFFTTIAIMQELFFVFNKKLYVYKNLAKLLIVTKKIENALETLGAEGKGMYEKALSVEEYIKESTLKELLVVADARNSAMHSKPEIDNINEILKKSNTILKEIRGIARFYNLRALFSKNISILKKLQIMFSLIIKTLLVVLFLYYVINFSYENAGVGGLILASIAGFLGLKLMGVIR